MVRDCPRAAVVVADQCARALMLYLTRSNVEKIKRDNKFYKLKVILFNFLSSLGDFVGVFTVLSR